MRAEGIIEQSTREWRSTSVLMKKQDGSVRYCIDFRDVNIVIKKDAFTMTSTDAILDKLCPAKFITKLDLWQAYFQIPLKENSRQYTFWV